MIDLGKLAVSLVVNGQADAEKGLQSFGNKIEGLAKGGLKAIGTGLVATTASITAMGASMFAMATKSAEATDRIDKMSQKVGMSRQAFQEWDFIASQSGMSVEQLQGGFKTLTAQITATTEGNKGAIANFEKLGISVTDSTGKLKSQEQVFEEAVSALQKMEDGTEKARLATELFGRSGSELMPLLNGASGSVEEMKQKAHELGLILSDESVDAGVKFTDTVDQLKRSFGAVVAEVGVKVMPLIQQLLEWVIEHMPEIQAVFEKVFGVISEVMDIVVRYVQNFLSWLETLFSSNEEIGKGLQDIWKKVQEVLKVVFDTLSEFVKAFVEMAVAFWDAFGEDIMKYTKELVEFLGAVFKTVFDLIIDIFKVFTAIFKGDWEGAWKAIQDLFSNYMKNISNVFKQYLDMIKVQLDVFGRLISGVWNALWNGIKSALENIWNSITSWFSNAVNAPVQLVLGISSAMNNAGRAIFNSLWDGLKSIWSNIQSWVSDKVSWISDKLTFWNNSSSKMQTNGSHRTGLDYVGYDGYIAELHRGEMVLTAPEAERYRNGDSGTGAKTITNNVTPVFNIYSTNGNPKEISRQIQKDLKMYNEAMGLA